MGEHGVACRDTGAGEIPAGERVGWRNAGGIGGRGRHTAARWAITGTLRCGSKVGRVGLTGPARGKEKNFDNLYSFSNQLRNKNKFR
jgi:hypothetical protein